MTEKKLPYGLKIVFAPGAFDTFDGTQEELDEMLKEIEAMVADGSFLEHSKPVDLEDGTWSEEEKEKLLGFMDQVDDFLDGDEPSDKRNLH